MILRRIPHAALLICGLWLATANAQEQEGTARANQSVTNAPNAQATSERVIVKDEEEKFFDDDGGRVFIVRRETVALDKLKHHGGKTIAEPQIVNVFLGEEWLEKSRRARQRSFSDPLATQMNAEERQWLEGIGVRNLPTLLFSYEERYDFGRERKISDMGVRFALAEMLKRGVVPLPKANLIYVVYLPEGVRSTLGEMFSGKHFLAYHNFFYSEQGRVNYVVAPFDSDAERMQQVAHRALIEAVTNSDGEGWR